MVFVFAFVTVTPISANSTLNTNTAYVDCVAAAFYYQSYLESLGMDPEAANAAADFQYTLCISNNQ